MRPEPSYRNRIHSLVVYGDLSRPRPVKRVCTVAVVSLHGFELC